MSLALISSIPAMAQTQQTSSTDSECLVGTLSIWNPRTGETKDPMEIYSGQEIYIGRDQKRCQYVVDDLLISNRHLLIYTIIFDKNHPEQVAPLVYAQDMSMNGTLWNGYQMGDTRGAYLLSDGDIFRLSITVYIQYKCEDRVKKKAFSLIQQMEMQAFEEEYVVTKCKLGSGAFGEVHMAYRKDNGQQLACKITDIREVKQSVAKQMGKNPGMKDYTSRFLENKLELYSREAVILEPLQHPNIISIEKVIKSDNTIYLFQELVTAGDLFSYLQNKGGKLPDIEAAVIVRQIAIALDYLHSRNIVHRDLKPDNILMTSRAEGGRVVLTDFGCARLMQPRAERMSTVIGTLEFSAPEVNTANRQGYTKSVDLWSLGCVTAVLVTGEAPFGNPKLNSSITRLHQQKALEKLEGILDSHSVGERAKDFIRRLLVFDESARMDVKQALKHPWFTNPAHRMAFEALYKRSIRYWKPRLPKKPLISEIHEFKEFLDSQRNQHSVGDSEYDSGDSSEFESNSHLDALDASQKAQPYSLISSDTDGMSGRGFSGAISQTLSDPNLPPHRGIYKPASVSSWHLQASREKDNSNLNENRAIQPTLWVPTSRIDTPAFGIVNGLRPRSYQTPSSSSEASRRSRVHLSERGEPRVRRLAGPLWINSSIGNKRCHSGSDDVEGEVYEEVSNAVTGERQHLAYGRFLGLLE